MHHALSRPLLAGSDNTIISNYSHKNSYFGKTFLKKVKWSITYRVYWTDDITETLWQSVQTILESICGKKSAGWMNKIYKKILMECSVSTQKNNPWVRYLHAADVRYHLDCWLVRAYLPGAIVTTITTSLVCCMCKYECWPGASVSDMHACMAQVYRYDCWLDATVKDMGNGLMQLLQTWLMVGCKCNIRGSW